MSSPTPQDVNRRFLESLLADSSDDESVGGVDLELTKAEPAEHVLRGSKSFTARSYRSRTTTNSLRVPSTHSQNENVAAVAHDTARPATTLNPLSAAHVLGEIQPNNQFARPGFYKIGRSPTPSLKKKKAEAIVKAHGSPTHVRVTAGGRIVPSEQSPLCHPRYGYSAIKANGGLIKFAPNSRPGQPNQWIESTDATTTNGSIVQDQQGNFCQIVDGIVHPLDMVDGAFRLHMEAPNVTPAQANSAFRPHVPVQPQPQVRPANRIQPDEPSVETQVAALEQEYVKLDKELKEVDKTEAIHGKHMPRDAKTALIATRRQLVTNLDKLRKAKKELQNRPPANAPTSPRAMMKRNSVSPRSRLPDFLQQRHPAAVLPASATAPPYGQLYGAGSRVPGPYALPGSSPEEMYGAQPWPMPPPNMFMQPPQFDGGMLPPMPTYQPPPSGLPTALPSIEGNIPQNDGSDEQQGDSPNRSRALSIRAPDSKPAAHVKSSLNPMSPAYKPASGLSKTSSGQESVSRQLKDRAPTPLSPLHQLQPTSQGHKPSTATDDTISPTKRATHLQSSSVSSFETADFFPKNTREYSTRQYAYPFHTEQSEDKENAHPDQSVSDRNDSPTTPNQVDQSTSHGPKDYTPHTGGFKAPAPPPGTPVHIQNASANQSSLGASTSRFEIPNREANNISPKNKREWYFVQEHPEKDTTAASCSPEKIQALRDELEVTTDETIDFTSKPREWIQGYQAGLQRKPVSAAHPASFMDGYCAGMLKSEEAPASSSTTARSTGSPLKTISRRPSPAVPSRSSSRLQLVEQAISNGSRPPLETAAHSMDTLKQAVFAPQNKNAVLTPAADGPHVSEAPLNLGAWAKAQQQESTRIASYNLPLRTTSTMEPRTRVDGRGEVKQQSANAYQQAGGLAGFSQNVPYQPASPSLSTMSIASSSIPSNSAPNTDKRITSITSIDSAMYRQWPGSRIMTPNEWKTESSVSHAAGLATGYFANAQFDGTHDVLPTPRLPGHSTDPLTSAGANQLQRTATVTSNTDSSGNMQHFTRFRENSLDRMSDSPTSPQAPMSPNLSPSNTPIRQNSARKAGTPSKTPSPTKAKFEHIAGKVGIKVTGSAGKNTDATSGGPTLEVGSPPDKRRWRDIWRKGGREGTE